MGLFSKYFVEIKRGTKVTYSESDLRKLDRNYEKEVIREGHRRVRSPLRKVPQQAYLTQVRDYAFERLLDSHMYTFKHLLVIPNPYDIVKQSALLLFNSSKETKIRYRVLGDTPEADFVGETQYTTRHRVPIMGLYLERSNKVELEMIDRDGVVLKRRMIRIYVSETPNKIKDVKGEILNKEMSHFPFILVNGVSFNPLVVDCNGDIRYSLQLRTNSIGMIPLQNGHFLYEDRTANRMNAKGQIKPCRYHEMDYFGRVYRTFLLDFPILGTVALDGNNLFIITSSDASHVADQIVALSMETGEVVSKCNLSDLIGEKYRTKENWADISYVTCQNNELLLTIKRLHTILKIDWENKKILWALAPKQIWEGTPVESYLLKGDIETEKICERPDFASIVERNQDNGQERMILFQEQSMGEIPLTQEDQKESSLSFLEIDDNKNTFHVISQHTCVKNKNYGSGIYSPDKLRILMCAGCLANGTDGRKSKFMEVDSKSGQVYREMYFKKTFNKAWIFKPDIAEFGNSAKMTENVIFGSVNPPEEFHGQLPKEVEDPVDSGCFSGAKLCGDLFLSNIMPGTIDRIYFIGENHGYVQDYSNMVNGKVKFPFAVSLREFQEDEYNIFVEYKNVVHRLKNEIRIVDE